MPRQMPLAVLYHPSCSGHSEHQFVNKEWEMPAHMGAGAVVLHSRAATDDGVRHGIDLAVHKSGCFTLFAIADGEGDTP